MNEDNLEKHFDNLWKQLLPSTTLLHMFLKIEVIFVNLSDEIGKDKLKLNSACLVYNSEC